MYNNEALDEHRKKEPEATIPRKFSSNEAKLAQQLCAVLVPFKVAARTLHEATAKPRASTVLPTVLAVLRAMREDQPSPMPDAADAGTFGYDSNEGKKSIASAEMQLTARSMKACLFKSLTHTLEKWLERAVGGNPTFEMLCVCSFLDPRYKTLHFLTDSERKNTYASTKTALIAIATRTLESAARLKETEVYLQVLSERDVECQTAVGKKKKTRTGKKARQKDEPLAEEESKAYGADDLFEEQAVQVTPQAMTAEQIMTHDFQDVPPFQPFTLLTGFRRITFQRNTCERNIYYDARTASGTGHFLLNGLLLGGLLLGGVHFTTWVA